MIMELNTTNNINSLLEPDDDDEEEYFDCEDNEEYFNHENDEEFTFMYLDENNTPIPADKALKNKDIHPIFPLFDQNLLSHEERKQLLPINPQVNKVFVESDQVALSSTSAYDRIESVAMGPYYKVGCSNSDGRDAFVFLKKPVRSAVEGSSLKGNGEKRKGLKAENGKLNEPIASKTVKRAMAKLPNRPQKIQALANRFINRKDRNEQIIVASPDGMYEKTFYESVEYESLLGWMTNDWMYLAPYYIGGEISHWVLFLICPKTRMGYIFDSDNRDKKKTQNSFYLSNTVERIIAMTIRRVDEFYRWYVDKMWLSVAVVGSCFSRKKPPGQLLKPHEAAVPLLHLPSRGILVYRSDRCAFSYPSYVGSLVYGIRLPLMLLLEAWHCPSSLFTYKKHVSELT
ncbi:ulp1 protease family, C-terminal catalytic domain-containing protein [Tanacetum coccineum]